MLALPSNPEKSQPTESAPKAPTCKTRVLLKGAVLAVIIMFSAECLRIFAGYNFYDVVPGKCYRSAQVTPAFLESIKRTHGICAVLNLRDENLNEQWYRDEKQSCEQLGLKLINAGLSSSDQPPEKDFWRFVHALDTCPEPMLIHCANGNDRTGLASAIYLMMRTQTPLPEARTQLSLRYGHFYWGKASCLQRILDSYEQWLMSEKLEHSADHFRYWAKNKYQQEKLR